MDIRGFINTGGIAVVVVWGGVSVGWTAILLSVICGW